MRRKLFLALLSMAAMASPLESSLALSPSPSPEHIGRSSRPVFIAGALRKLTIWEYPHPRSSNRTIRFSFAPTDSGIRIVSTGSRSALSDEQVDCLETVRNDLVHSAEPGRFGAPVSLQQEPLPIQATLSQDGEGSLAKISLSLDDLLGGFDDGAIRYRFALASRSSEIQRTVSHLGTLEVRIEPADGPPHLAAPLPGGRLAVVLPQGGQ